jgi:hypothetical protein
LLVGRRIWIIRDGRGGIPEYIEGGQKGMIVTGLKAFLPVGPYSHPDGYVAERKEPLLQIYTNPPGLRTVTAGSIRIEKP